MTESRGVSLDGDLAIDEIYDQVRRAAPAALAGAGAPTPATACVLWRRAGDAASPAPLEVYMVQRALGDPFLGGFWCFAGGRIEPTDAGEEAACAREVEEELGIALPEDSERYLSAARFVTPPFSAIQIQARYFLVQAPAGAAPDPLRTREHRAGTWVRPADALDHFARGEWLMPEPVLISLEALASATPGDLAAVCARMAAAALGDRERRLWRVAGGVAVCPVLTPTLPPATHTNTYVVGTRELAIVDPASPYDGERAALDQVLETLLSDGAKVTAILLTHHHLDHVGGVEHLAARLGAPVCAHPETARLLAGRIRVDRAIEDGDVIELAGDPPRRLRALFTPGHAPGHLCFLEEETGLAMVGDMVASVGTILVDPSEGDMRQYLDSLDLLAAARPRVLLPAHGGAIADPPGKLAEYVRHRLWREERVAAALARVERARAADLVPTAYADVSPALFPLAQRSLISHLVKLVADGRVRRDGDDWVIAG